MTSLSSQQIERPALAPPTRLQGLRDGKLPRRLAVAALILLLAFLSLYPLSMLLYGSLHTPRHPAFPEVSICPATARC